ncbi:MAG: PAS domain S-box protein, partial [Deltaproteobacteria bacterium]|nr:PAS domain S-box protein [Deltaproteobacteria bacterium]
MKNDRDSRNAEELEKSKATIRRLKKSPCRMRTHGKSLNDKLESYRHLSENIPCAAYSVLPQKNTPPLFVSSKIEEITGYPADAFLKDPYLKMKIVHPNDRDRVRQALEDTRENKGPLDIEYRILTKDGRERWVRDKDSPVLNRAGETTRINGFMEDITARVSMEEALIKSEERYRDLVENAGDIIIVLQDERIKYFNRKAIELTGYTRDEISFTPFEKFVHPDDMKQIVRRYNQRISGKNLDERFQFRLRKNNGSYLWAEVGSKLIEWEGRPAILDFITDISGRKEALDALHRSEQQLQSTFDSIKESVCLLDTENRIIKHNRAMGRLCGKRNEVIENRYCYEVVHGLNRRFEDCPFEEMVRTRHRAGTTMDLDGRWYEVSIDPIITADNELIGGVHIMRDITQKKLDEKQRSDMEQRSRQTRKFESLGVMAGGIAHDFNNLLTAVLG